MDIDGLEPGHRVEMYVSRTCPYCTQAREHFDARGYPYEVYDAQNDRAHRAAMFGYTGGDPTVPAIVVDGAFVQSGWGSPLRG
jgi:glutaredoxin 3